MIHPDGRPEFCPLQLFTVYPPAEFRHSPEQG
jgi:hypothetical protein